MNIANIPHFLHFFLSISLHCVDSLNIFKLSSYRHIEERRKATVKQFNDGFIERVNIFESE